MRIVQVHNRYLQAGGEDAVVATEARLLRAAGHEVTTAVVSNPDSRAAAVSRLAVAAWNPRAADRVHRVVTEQRPDVVHVHNTWYSLSPAVLAAARDAGPAVVMTLHNYRTVCAAATLFRDGAPCTDCVGSHAGHAVRHRCYRGSVGQSAVAAGSIELHRRRGTWHRDVDRFLALTGFGRQLHLDAGFPPDRTGVKSNSVADPGPRTAPPSRSREVVVLGRLTEEKGVGRLLEAWRLAAPEPLELVVVGDGPQRAALEAGAPPGVRFEGSRPTPWVTDLLLRARALVMPSIWFEGQGLVALEAAAAGLAVLHPRLGAMAGLFAPGEDGLSYAPEGATPLVEALGRLRDDAFVDARGGFTRQRFEERYTHDVARETLEEAYAAAIRNRGRHARGRGGPTG